MAGKMIELQKAISVTVSLVIVKGKLGLVSAARTLRLMSVRDLQAAKH